ELLEDYQILDPSEIPEFNVEAIFPAKQLESQLTTLAELEPGLSLDKYRDRWQDAVQRLEAVSKMPRVKVNQRALQTAHKEVLGFFSGLRSELGKALADRSDPTGWHANLASFAPDTPALGDSWRRRVEALVPLSDLPVLAADNNVYIERRQSVDKWVEAYQELQNFLMSLQLPAVPGSVSRERQARFDVINDQFKALATESMVAFIDGLSQPFAADPSSRASFEAWQSAMEKELREPLSSLEAGLNDLELSLGGDGQGTFSGQISLMDRFWPQERPAPELDALYLAAQDMRTIDSSSSAPELFRIFEKSPWPGIRWAVWRKSQELDTWPRTRADLQYARELGLRLNASGLSSEDLDNTLYVFWQNAQIAASNRNARSELWDFMDEQKWDPGQLPEAWQYDRIVCSNLKAPIARVEREEALAVRNSFIQSLNKLGSVTTISSVKQFIANLNQLTFDQGRHIDPELLEQAGPGKAGWRMQDAEPTGKWVQYVWASENLKVNEGFDGYVLSFSLVESAGGDRFYISTDEVAAGLFFDWIDERAGWNSFRSRFPGNAFGSDQPQKDIEWRRGPRAWTLEDNGTLVVAYDWQLQSNTQGVPVAPGIDQGPSRFSPMNYLTGDAALDWAANLECRLPTPDEFVMAREWANSNLDDSNLRDSTWERQLRYLLEGSTSPSFDRWPDLECFAPDGVVFVRGKDAKAATDTNDGILWFMEVGTPGSDPSKILNLHGNVAEFLSATESGNFLVVGGSAISPAEVDWKTPYPVPGDSSMGFSDVGFRMAFDAPVPLPGRILLEAFGGAPELPLN
ncbi:MAG TPA: hypothetical protein VK995_00390, partial [Oceanipulchritudo sp.]|nr:hypothetical protein [Oceanipulchritudo sp.]